MLLAWTDYYSGSGTLYQQQTTRLTSFSGTAYIKNCFFNGLSTTDQAGAISCYSSSSLLMLIESSTFINVQGASYGGAIYFSYSGQYVSVKVCGYGCKSTSSHSQFEYVQVTNGISSRNEVHDSSICGTNQPSQNYEMLHHYGKIIIDQTNFSSNSCRYGAPIHSNPSSNGNYVASTISYTTVANNVVASGMCIVLESSNLHEVYSCNFISNTDQSSNNGLMIVSGSLNLRDSCILNNSATYVIRNSGGKSITVTNCTMDSTSKFSGTVTISSTPKTSFINRIDHIETALCFSKYDSIGSLTVVPNTIKTYPNGIPPDKIEIILEMYCNKHMTVDIIRAFNYLLIHFLASDKC
jgi:hypothetical protein